MANTKDKYFHVTKPKEKKIKCTMNIKMKRFVFV